MMAWEPVNFIALADGLEIHADDIAMTIGKGNTALATHAWPEDGNEYALCRQVPDGGVILATPERVAALEYMMENIHAYKPKTVEAVAILRAMLQEMKGDE